MPLWYKILTSVIVIMGIYCFTVVSDRNSLKNELQSHRQNSQYVIDSLTHGLDSIQSISVKVSDLLQESESTYTGMKTHYEQVIRRLRAQGTATTIVYVDSSDPNATYYKVSFAGDTSIVKFAGHTIAYVDSTRKADWDLEINFDTIRTSSELIYNKNSELWQIQTTSLTPGLELRGFGTVDQKLFNRLQNVTFTGPKTFYVGGQADWKTVAPGIALRIGDNLYEVSYIVLGEGSSWLERIRLSFMKGIF